MMGFPLRLLAREVYDRVCAIKGPERVALITGEERIEPKNARWLLCTVEAMPVDRDLAFVALDEAQLAADPDRGHVFTDRLLHARGREETMILGSATLQPVLRKLVPDSEVVERPRFSTLSHASARKLSRIPPRSAIVAFSAEQVYGVAEMLRRFRGGAAVVMGALSPETRNRQVELYQSGEVDYLVATDAIGMGLNLDLQHVAFAGLSKFDGVRQRRLTTVEMAQIAGRAGRHQRDGTFGALLGTGGGDAEFTPEEIYALEEHRFAPLTDVYWRNPDLDMSSLAGLIDSLEQPASRPALITAPQATDLAVLKHLAEDPVFAVTITGERQVRRFWQACCLPDFRQYGPDHHARFVARLWQYLAKGQLQADYVARSIAELDRPDGDIDTLQMRIAAIRSWAYVAQRPDWVQAKKDIAGLARAAEARLSEALHSRLTERFVNRRTAILMRQAGGDGGLLPVAVADGVVTVADEAIGRLAGFRFMVDPGARHADRKLLLAVAERQLPNLLAERATELVTDLSNGQDPLDLTKDLVLWDGEPVARLRAGKGLLGVRIELDKQLDTLPAAETALLEAALQAWLDARLAKLAPLYLIEAAVPDLAAGPALRSILIGVVEGGGAAERKGLPVDSLSPDQRQTLRKLGIKVGTLDLFVPEALRPGPLAALRIVAAARGISRALPHPVMPPALRVMGSAAAPPGYRRLVDHAVRIDMAEKLLRQAHEARLAKKARDFAINPALAVSTGLSPAAFERLLRQGGFGPRAAADLPVGAFGPPQPTAWRWLGHSHAPVPARGTRTEPGNPFRALAEQLR